MNRRFLLSCLLLAPGMAQAASTPADPNGGPWLDLAPMALPLVVDGRLVNYVFITLRLDMISKDAANKAFSREPVLRDALLKTAHRTPFTLADDWQHVDEKKLKAALIAHAEQLFGKGQAKGMTILSQKPQRYVAPPRQGAKT